jgi:hypothetical protein
VAEQLVADVLGRLELAVAPCVRHERARVSALERGEAADIEEGCAAWAKRTRPARPAPSRRPGWCAALRPALNPSLLASLLGRSGAQSSRALRRLGLRAGRWRSAHHPMPTNGGRHLASASSSRASFVIAAAEPFSRSRGVWSGHSESSTRQRRSVPDVRRIGERHGLTFYARSRHRPGLDRCVRRLSSVTAGQGVSQPFTP